MANPSDFRGSDSDKTDPNLVLPVVAEAAPTRASAPQQARGQTSRPGASAPGRTTQGLSRAQGVASPQEQSRWAPPPQQARAQALALQQQQQQTARPRQPTQNQQQFQSQPQAQAPLAPLPEETLGGWTPQGPSQAIRQPQGSQGFQSQAQAQPQAQARLQVSPPPSAAQAPQAARPNVKMPDLGPLDAFMRDPAITEVMINDTRNVMIESGGKMRFSGFSFQGLDELNRIVRLILDSIGKILTPDSPLVDGALPDGSRVNIVGPPLTLGGPCVTIRKFPTRRMSIEDLMGTDMLDRRMAYFLNACVVGRINILVAGGTGSGKTTVLNALTALVPKSERLISIEDTPELVLEQINSVRLQTKPQTPTLPAITARDLVANSLRMRPDRIIVGECRRAEAFDMLQAMNTGHTGSMTTIHANSARDALARVETLAMLAATDLPLTSVRRQVASALDLIVYVRRFRSGKRRIVQISELTGMEGETITLQDIFSYDSLPGVAGQGEQGMFRCLGFVPTFIERLREAGIELPRDFFA